MERRRWSLAAGSLVEDSVGSLGVARVALLIMYDSVLLLP